MLNDDEINVISSSQCTELDDTGTTKAYQTEAALSSPIETYVKVTDDISQSKEEESTVIFGLEEEMTEESGKQSNVEVDNGNVANTSTSSLRIIFSNKERNGISGNQLSLDDCGETSASQTGYVKLTNEDASQGKDEEENAMPLLENVKFVSEEGITQGREIQHEKNLDEYNTKEENALGEEDKMDENDNQRVESAMKKDVDEENEQALVRDQIGNKSKEERDKKKVLKKVEKTGMIFMCSHKTKQDCFDYKVFGLPASKRDVVRKVSKGMRLFLFDIDLRVMYGIYKAAAPGDYNIEPRAFRSAFPSQVRFTVVNDCTPLTEEKFRVAIKDNYYRKNIFSFELTSEQVKNLCKIFVAEIRVPSLNLKNHDVANSSQANELSSIPIDMDIEGNGSKITQANPVEEKVDEENAIYNNKERICIEQKNDEAVTEEEKKNKENNIIEANVHDGKNASEEEQCANEGGTGMIFMCSSKTKQDCLHYKVLGLPANKREIVQKVEKGMNLFMFDVDLRLMYGIYKAAGPGGYNIEPKAFNSSFPAQVQFTVVKDCPPLTEEKFRMVIKDNYYRKNKFKFLLTSDQVKKLCQLFVADSLSLKQDNVANTSQSKENLSAPVEMNVEGTCGQITQADQIEEAINEENAIVGNNANTNTKEEKKELVTEENKKDKNDFMVGDKTKEPVCFEGDDDDEESASEEGDEDEEEETQREKNGEEVGVNSQEKVRKMRKRRRVRNLRAGNTGMIFMCSSRTKPDCLRYKVLGLPANKREVVEKIHRGMRLFMFDVELRVMYGIYKAAGPGGYNLEPMAFNSGFPSQVRFTVVEDYLPLEEEKFKVAIKDNYFTKWKFNCELTSEQVKNLCRLFTSANRRGDRIRQQRIVPLVQLPPPAHSPMYGSYGNDNVYRHGPSLQHHGPPLQPHDHRSGRSWYGRSRPY